MKNLFTPKAIDVDRVLLVNYPKILDVKSLKQESGVSKPQISAVTHELIRRSLAAHGEGRYRIKLTAPTLLLEEWATVSDFTATTKFIDYYSPEQDISRFLDGLKHIKSVDYAVTGLTGAFFVAPFVRPTNVHIYVKTEEDAKKIANLLELVPVEASGNVKFAVAENSDVFYGAEKRNGLCVVSLPQLYVDL